ncbi:MAG: hypothetical protein WD489_08230 [Rhodovibrionaceae bacterium]
MQLHAKISLRKAISSDVLESVNSYLKQFGKDKHTIEHFDGAVFIYVSNDRDAALLKENFPDVVADIEELY